MDTTYWQKQTDKPLFPELEWNKPERRDQAGRLLIIGGNVHNLSAPARAYAQTRQAGIGEVKIVLPDKTRRMLNKNAPDTVFLPSTSSGELAQAAAPELLEYAQWADTILLPGDNGRNSQTTILFEELLQSYRGQIILTRDAVDVLSSHPAALLERANTSLIISFAQLQKLLQAYSFLPALTYTMSLAKLVEILHQLTSKSPCAIATLHNEQIIVASQGQLITTKLVDSELQTNWRLPISSLAACYQTWYPTKPLEALAGSASSYLITGSVDVTL